MAEPNFQSPMVGDERSSRDKRQSSLFIAVKQVITKVEILQVSFMIMLQVYDQIVIRISHETL